MRIPKKIYFTFKTENPPEKYLGNLHKWHELCPNWEIHYFSDSHIYAFFKEHFPEYYEDLPKITCGAALADLFRYGVLYVQGGMYTDLDTVLLKKIPDEWLSYQAVIGYEHQPSKFPNSPGDHDIFCQWTLLAAPKYPLFKEALDESIKRLHAIDFHLDDPEANYAVVGPEMFTAVAKKYTSRTNVLLLDLDVFGAWERGISPTENSVVKHLFHGYYRWKQEQEFPQLNFY